MHCSEIHCGEIDKKSGIDCNVAAFVSGLRCTLSKTAVQRNPLQKFKIPTFGTVMEILEKYNLFFTFPNDCAIQTKHGTNKLLNKTCAREYGLRAKLVKVGKKVWFFEVIQRFSGLFRVNTLNTS